MADTSSSPSAVGRCACGKVTVAVTGEPMKSFVCHCNACQVCSASAGSAVWVFPMPSVKIGGETNIFNLTPRNNRHSCPSCRTFVSAQPMGPDGKPLGVYGLACGLFRANEYRDGVQEAPKAWWKFDFHQDYSKCPIEIRDGATKYRDMPAEQWGLEDGAMDGVYTNVLLNDDRTEK